MAVHNKVFKNIKPAHLLRVPLELNNLAHIYKTLFKRMILKMNLIHIDPRFKRQPLAKLSIMQKYLFWFCLLHSELAPYREKNDTQEYAALAKWPNAKHELI